MASVPSPTVTYRWRHYSFLLFVPSKSRFLSILANNSNSYTLHRYLPLLRSHIVLVYFEPLIRLPIPTFHLTTILFLLSRLVWAISVEPHRIAVWSRGGHLGSQGSLRMPVQEYTHLELNSDWNGDNKSGSGWTSVCADFSDEVALRLNATIAGLVLVEVRKSNWSFLLANARQPRSSNNVPSGWQETDVVLPAQVPRVNFSTRRTANARRRKQDAKFACTVPGCARGSTFTRISEEPKQPMTDERSDWWCWWWDIWSGWTLSSMPDRVASFSDHAAVLLYVFVSFTSYVNAWPLFFISSNLPCFQSHFFHSLHCIASQFFLHFNRLLRPEKGYIMLYYTFFFGKVLLYIFEKSGRCRSLFVIPTSIWFIPHDTARLCRFYNSRPKIKFSLTVQVH